MVKKYVKTAVGTSLVVQWLRLRASNAGGAGSIPGWGTTVPHAVRLGPPKKIFKKMQYIWTFTLQKT